MYTNPLDVKTNLSLPSTFNTYVNNDNASFKLSFL